MFGYRLVKRFSPPVLLYSVSALRGSVYPLGWYLPVVETRRDGHSLVAGEVHGHSFVAALLGLVYKRACYTGCNALDNSFSGCLWPVAGG